MNKDEIIQYIVYGLWVTLILVVILIINRKVKQRLEAKKALLNPMINLYSYEFRRTRGEITFFFDADAALAYEFFLTNAETGETQVISSGTCRKGGQKIHLDTRLFTNGLYFYGISTDFQRVEKKIIIDN